MADDAVLGLLDEIAGIGRDRESGGYRRFAWNDADLRLREWFTGQATARSMHVTEDGNGNLFARRGQGRAVMVGSHLDSVPDGGAFDGPLGVVSAFAAADRIGPDVPVVIAAFSDEEGARFGVACAGSRLLTGSLDPERALALRDQDGITMAEAMRAAGRDPRAAGTDLSMLDDVAAFVELHIEQGRYLVHTGQPIGVASSIWPHGRWRLEFTGRANHAGTTDMSDRQDPMTAYAATVLAARQFGIEHSGRATFGRLHVEPGGTNAVPARVRAWLDARAPDETRLTGMVDAIVARAEQAAAHDDTGVVAQSESASPLVEFDADLRERLAGLLGAPVMDTAAGHDAGVLAAHVPTAMLFVRNPTGVSHAPDEHADDADCAAGVDALTRVIAELSRRAD